MKEITNVILAIFLGFVIGLHANQKMVHDQHPEEYCKIYTTSYLCK